MNTKDILQRCKQFVRKRWYSKFTIAAVCFFVWVLFFDKYNFSTQRKLSESVEKLEKEKIAFIQKTKETEKQLRDIELHKERYAREHYYMHKPNEEILVINPEE